MPASILIVDDESGIRESLGALLRDEGYEVETTSSGEECLGELERRSFDLVLLDVWLPKMDGLTTLEAIQAREAAPVVITGTASKPTATTPDAKRTPAASPARGRRALAASAAVLISCLPVL